MISPKYLVRLDDAHLKMHHVNWQLIENILDSYNIKPIVGVIPECEDLTISYPNTFSKNLFWKKVKLWESKGWAIAVHGLHHNLKKSKFGILPVNNISEFVGLSYEFQYQKILKSLNIFNNYELFPKLWMAPAHSMDMNTIHALRTCSIITTISDGFSFRPYKRFGFNWIPQQLWKCRIIPFGTWTICLHPNTIDISQINSFKNFLEKYSKDFYATNSLYR